jgi:hypothetical protein
MHRREKAWEMGARRATSSTNTRQFRHKRQRTQDKGGVRPAYSGGHGARQRAQTQGNGVLVLATSKAIKRGSGLSLDRDRDLFAFALSALCSLGSGLWLWRSGPFCFYFLLP